MERAGPRAFHTMQYEQRLSQPSWTLRPGRMRPVGVTAPPQNAWSASAPPPSWPNPRRLATRCATRSLSGSTTMRGSNASSSAENRDAVQPVATIARTPGSSAARRRSLRVLACASEVTAHVFTTIASASSRHTMRMPSRESSRPIASSSALFTRQPRLTSETLARPITSCAWASQRLHGHGDGRRSPRPARQPWRRRRARLGQPRWSGSPRGPRRRGRRARSR